MKLYKWIKSYIYIIHCERDFCTYNMRETSLGLAETLASDHRGFHTDLDKPHLLPCRTNVVIAINKESKTVFSFSK